MIRISSHCFKNIYYGCSPSPVNPSKDEEETILYIFMILAGQLICFVSVCERERKKEKWPDANSLPLFSKLLMRHTHTHTHTTMHNTDTQKERERETGRRYDETHIAGPAPVCFSVCFLRGL
jgi:hypothetical protein